MARGHNETLVRHAIAGRRDEVRRATKFSIIRGAEGRIDSSPDGLEPRVEESLRRLGTNVIDLFYVTAVRFTSWCSWLHLDACRRRCGAQDLVAAFDKVARRVGEHDQMPTGLGKRHFLRQDDVLQRHRSDLSVPDAPATGTGAGRVVALPYQPLRMSYHASGRAVRAVRRAAVHGHAGEIIGRLDLAAGASAWPRPLFKSSTDTPWSDHTSTDQLHHDHSDQR